LDYIHWNPIKHGYVKKPEDWPFSTFRAWVEMDVYELGWGWNKVPESISGMDIE
jgi:putative transposase